MVTAALTAAAPAIAHGVQHALFAHNSDKVDGKHAVASSASTANRKGKLVATSPTTGRLPNNIIATAPNAAKLQGKSLTAWDAKRVIDTQGLPPDTEFTTNGGTLIIFASGSGYWPSTAVGHGRIGADIVIDSSVQATIQTYTNEKSSHKAFVPEFAVVEDLPAGIHTLSVNLLDAEHCGGGFESDSMYCTATDANDVFHVMVMEIPD